MNYALLNPLRNFTRKLGINSFIANLSYKKWYQVVEKEYSKNKPSKVTIELSGISILMNVENLSEYERVMSFKNDSKIINSILAQLSGKKDVVFWDIGANIGLYSMFVAKSSNVQRIVCFEPEPRCIERIEANKRANVLNNIQIYPVALSDTIGLLNLTTNHEFGAGNHSLVNTNIGAGNDTIVVNVKTGDYIIKEYKEKIPNIIKIDVEGAEINVLKGMSNTLKHPNCKMIICEIHFAILSSVGYGNGAKEAIQVLKANGFNNISWIDTSHLIATK